MKKGNGFMNNKLKYWCNRLNDMPCVSAVLVIANVIVFLICTFTGDLLYNIGNTGAAYILGGEYYRMFTAMFLHVDSSYLVGNMLILFGLGTMIEKEVGHVKFGIFYLAAGICGDVLSVYGQLISGDFFTSVGASGAVFGLDGILVALVLFSGKNISGVTLPRIFLMLVCSLYSGFVSADYIDNGAHIGGLIGGFLLGTGLCAVRRLRKKRRSSMMSRRERYGYRNEH